MASCELRADIAPGPPRSVAILSSRNSVSRCSARCRSWPIPLPACTG